MLQAVANTDLYGNDNRPFCTSLPKLERNESHIFCDVVASDSDAQINSYYFQDATMFVMCTWTPKLC